MEVVGMVTARSDVDIVAMASPAIGICLGNVVNKG